MIHKKLTPILAILMILIVSVVATTNEPYIDYSGVYKGRSLTSTSWDDPNHYYNDQSQLTNYYLFWSDYDDVSFQGFNQETSIDLPSAFGNLGSNADLKQNAVVSTNNLIADDDNIWFLMIDTGGTLITAEYSEDSDTWGYFMTELNSGLGFSDVSDEIFLMDVDSDDIDELLIFNGSELVALQYNPVSVGYYDVDHTFTLDNTPIGNGNSQIEYINSKIYIGAEASGEKVDFYKLTPSSNPTISTLGNFGAGDFGGAELLDIGVTSLNGINPFLYVTTDKSSTSISTFGYVTNSDNYDPHYLQIYNSDLHFYVYPMNVDNDASFEIIVTTLSGYVGIVNCDTPTSCSIIDTVNSDSDKWRIPFSAEVDSTSDGYEVCFIHNNDVDKFGIKCQDGTGNIVFDSYLKLSDGSVFNRSNTNDYDYCADKIFKTYSYSEIDTVGQGASAYPHDIFVTPHFSFRFNNGNAIVDDASIYYDDWNGEGCPTLFGASWIDANNNYPDLWGLTSSDFYSLIKTDEITETKIPLLLSIDSINNDDIHNLDKSCIDTDFKFKITVRGVDDPYFNDFDFSQGYQVRISDNQTFNTSNPEFNINWSDLPVFYTDFFEYTPDNAQSYLQSPSNLSVLKDIVFQFRNAQDTSVIGQYWIKEYPLYNNSVCTNINTTPEYVGENPYWNGQISCPANPIKNGVESDLRMAFYDADGGSYKIKYFPDLQNYNFNTYEGNSDVGVNYIGDVFNMEHNFSVENNEIRLFWSVIEIYSSNDPEADTLTNVILKNNDVYVDLFKVTITDVLSDNIHLNEAQSFLDANPNIRIIPIVVCGNETDCYGYTPITDLGICDANGNSTVIDPTFDSSTDSVADSLDNLWNDLNLKDTKSKTFFGFVLILFAIITTAIVGLKLGANGQALFGLSAMVGVITLFITTYLGLTHFGFIILIFAIVGVVIGLTFKFGGNGGD